MTPGNYRYGDQVNYSDLESVRFQIYVDDTAPTSNLSSVTASFSRCGTITQALPVTVVDAAAAIFDVDEVAAASFTLAHGSHDFSATCTFADGSVDTYISTTNSVNIIQNPQA
tara:strand:+ start:149 stop:487 length:339 start_codon:yes stop_codon:yes gene_type:complete